MRTRWICALESLRRTLPPRGRKRPSLNASRYPNDGCRSCYASDAKPDPSRLYRTAVGDRELLGRTKKNSCGKNSAKRPMPAWTNCATIAACQAAACASRARSSA